MKKSFYKRSGVFATPAAIFLLLSYSLIYFNSCKFAVSVNEDRFYVYLTDNSKYFLLPTEGIEKSMDMIQQIAASYGGQNFYLNAWVKADENEIMMTLLNEMGARMGELTFRNGNISFISPVFPGTFRPEYIIADFQLCFFDPFLVGLNLEKSGLSLEIQGNNRRIFEGNNCIMEIEKTSNRIRLVNNIRGYAFTLEGLFE